MMKRAAVLASLAPLLSVASAHADDGVTTETANTLVVVTPNAPVVVTQQAPAQTMPATAPGLAAPVAPPAPQNEEWSNVSHINGQLVKVGERGDYLLKLKKSNLAANPFGPFFGYYDAAYSYAVSNNVAVTGALSGYSKGTDYSDKSMFQITASLPVYFKRAFSGPFIEPGIIYRTNTSSYNYECAGCDNSANTRSWAGPELLLGWHHNFDSGLNIVYAFGVAKHMSDSDQMATNSDPDVNGYLRIGYNF